MDPKGVLQGHALLPLFHKMCYISETVQIPTHKPYILVPKEKAHLVTWILGPLGVPREHAPPPSFHKMLIISETVQIPTHKLYWKEKETQGKFYS